jgi:hypothetical protein
MRPPIAHYGTFDVANYGDLLFPLVLERRIGDLAPLLHVSPVGGPAPIAGGVASVPPSAVPDALAGVVVGGGHLIHASPSGLADYQTTPSLALEAYPSLWLGAAEKALGSGAPLVWNGPGAPAAFGVRAAPVLAWATSFLDYGAVRDGRSRAILEAAGGDGSFEVVPDTGLEVAALFDDRALDHAYREAFRSRGLERAGPTLALHANARYLREEIPLVAARLSRLCARTGTLPILLALGPCRGDDALARTLAQHMTGPVLVIDRPQSLCEIAACIARSEAYLGSSLHGALTACAFGRKAAIVARESGDGGKFSGFLGAFDLSRWLLRDWEAAEASIDALWAADAGPWRRVAADSAPGLERHWSRLRDALAAPPRRQDAREAARRRLGAMLGAVEQEFGIHTLLLAHQAELTLDQMAQRAQQREQTAALKASYRAAARGLRRRIAELEGAGSPSEAGSDPSD